MVRKVKIDVLEIPDAITTVFFFISQPPNSTVSTFGLSTSYYGSSSVLIGATTAITADNIKDFYNSFTFPSWITCTATRTASSVEITFTSANDFELSSFNTSSSKVAVYEVVLPVTQPTRVALCRSTYSLRFVPSELFDTASIDLYFFKGDVNLAPATPTYSLSKQVTQLGQFEIAFQINELAKEYLSSQVDNYENAGLQDSNYDNSVWCKYQFKAFDGSTVAYEVDGALYCLYGYGYSNEGYNFNPQPLFNQSKDIHYRGQNNRLYFITDGLDSLEVNGTPVTLTVNTDNNTQYMCSINLNDYDATANEIVVEAVYGADTYTTTYEVKEECKYDVVNCVYYSKFGVPKSMFFTKVRKDKDEIEGDSYQGLLLNNGVYNINDHQNRVFNVNGERKLTLNTDYLPEYMNENVKQLLLSERIWLLIDGIYQPATIESKSVDYKTSLNDRLINYTLEFKYAQPIINTIC